MGEQSMDVDLTDVTSSAALVAVKAAAEDGRLSSERALFLTEKYTALHDALVATMARDEQLVSKAEALNSQVAKSREKIDAQGALLPTPSPSQTPAGAGDHSTVETLREDAEQAEAEVTLCREREQMLKVEVAELERQREEYRSSLEEAEREHAAALAPQIRALRDEIDEVSKESTASAEREQALRVELNEILGRTEAVLGDERARQAELSRLKDTLAKSCALSDKLRKQVDVVSNAVKGLVQHESRLADKAASTDREASSLDASARELSEEHARAAATLEHARAAIAKKERTADEIRKDLEIAGLEADQHLSDQVAINMKLKAVGQELKRERTALARSLKEKEQALKKYKKEDVALSNARGSAPALQTTRDQTKQVLGLIESQCKRHALALDELKREIDVHMNNYLKEEAVGKEKSVLFQQSYAEVAALEREVLALRKEEVARLGLITEASSQRERMSRDAATKVNKVRETKEYIKVKDLVILDLKKKRKETHTKLKDCTQLYELVRNQRNKFVALIQASSQSIAEMKEKLKILSNETEILRVEAVSKDRLLSKARLDHSAADSERDHLRANLNRCALQFRERQASVDEQIAEVDKLNAIINMAEKDMLHRKKQYETGVETRNQTGITLIDRNDELCILYEKRTMQEEVLRQGELELQRRDDEIRMLKLEIREVSRSTDAARKVVHHIPKYDESAVSLQQQLLEARRKAQELSDALESPENRDRWRRLEGKVPDEEELSVKIGYLEERYNDKREQLLEKELILEEVSALSERLQQQAAEGRADTLELAKRVNGYQAKIRAITRRMMATVSELSMYKASSMKLQQERDELVERITEAAARMDAGLAPTEDAERDWYRLERERLELEEVPTAARDTHQTDDKSTGIRTTAEPRPNAYVPSDLGIPRPYGGMAPFKPSEAGSTMRFIRRPAPKELLI